MTDLAKLKELAERATHGEWELDGREVGPVWDSNASIAKCSKREDAAFIAAANPQAILWLIAEVERLSESVRLSELIIEERDRLLSTFECQAHGNCVPHAMEEVKALRKDAERYRWLRGHTGFQGWDGCEPEELDAAVDAALEGGGR